MQMSQDEWQRAQRIARELAHSVDRNELGKIVSYAHRTQDTERVLKLVARLPRSRYIHSQRTRDYLQRIADVLPRELRGLSGPRSLLVLSWAFRLMTYYQTEAGTRTAAGRERRE
jgi:hypothetical protein